VVRVEGEDAALAAGRDRARLGHDQFHHEAAARLQVSGRVAEDRRLGTTSDAIQALLLDHPMKATRPDKPRFPAFSRPRGIRATYVDTDSVCPGRGFQDPQQQLTPPAAVVNDIRGPASGQVGGETVSALGGKRPVKRQPCT
jgi:hypothetical protein